jgi:hypothetical protein
MTTARQAYVNAVVSNYVRLPGTPMRASSGDRHFAGVLYEQRVPLRVVYAGFVLATARREIRSPSLPRLPAIRTLRFFQGAIDEVLGTRPDPAYIDYLAAKIKPLVADKDPALRATNQRAVRRPGASPDAPSTPRQNSALPDRR